MNTDCIYSFTFVPYLKKNKQTKTGKQQQRTLLRACIYQDIEDKREDASTQISEAWKQRTHGKYYQAKRLISGQYKKDHCEVWETFQSPFLIFRGLLQPHPGQWVLLYSKKDKLASRNGVHQAQWRSSARRGFSAGNETDRVPGVWTVFRGFLDNWWRVLIGSDKYLENLMNFKNKIIISSQENSNHAGKELWCGHFLHDQYWWHLNSIRLWARNVALMKITVFHWRGDRKGQEQREVNPLGSEREIKFYKFGTLFFKVAF